MSTDTLLSGPAKPAASGTTKSVVIFLHGYGADGNDLIGLAPHLARALPDTTFYSPNAPFPCEMSPFGRQWFSLAEYDPEFLRRAPETMSGALAAMAEGARKSAAYVNDFIDHVMETHGVSADKVALVGFSQGTMMSLQTAPDVMMKLPALSAFPVHCLANRLLVLKSKPVRPWCWSMVPPIRSYRSRHRVLPRKRLLPMALKSAFMKGPACNMALTKKAFALPQDF